VALFAALLPLAYGGLTRHGPALADEFVYLGGARHLALTGSLNARYYDAHALLAQGYPHQDNHSPGYVLLLGGLVALVKGGYWTAVALNALAYIASGAGLYRLARHLGRSPSQSWIAVGLFVALPAVVPYLFWAMAELPVVALFLATLACAARWGGGLAGGALTGVVLGCAFLVRESSIFGLAAVLVLLRGKRAIAAFTVGLLATILLVYAPLSKNRSAGASNFWAPTYGKEFGFEVVQSAIHGDVGRAARVAFKRASMNIREVVADTTTWTERGILVLLGTLPAWALLQWPTLSATERRLALALTLGWLAMASVMTFVYVLGRWAGFRYLLVLAPPFLAFIPRTAAGEALARRRRFAIAVFVAASLAIDAGIFGILTRFKESRQRRQQGITAYVEKYLDAGRVRRIALPNGWLFGLKHYPVEVISSLPQEGRPLRLLERKVEFDALVLPGDSPLREEWDGRLRYRRLNTGDPEPPLLVYQRLK
jgi:hypothetical protein